MIARIGLLETVRAGFQNNPIVSLLGARQVGKTTLARCFAENAAGKVDIYDLESPTDIRRLTVPEMALSEPFDYIIIDEIQRKPDLFELLRVLADRRNAGTRFLILGSASPKIVRGITESLAGRVAFIDVHGFSLAETGMDQLKNLWVKGGFPRAFLSQNPSESMKWREDFIRTFLERDIPELGIHIPSETLRRFWMMTAHYHGQIWNGSEFGRSLGFSEATARRYLDILSGAYMVRILPPWFENISKRQVKSPKIYVRDSGLLHALLGLEEYRDLMGHPKAGASWEGFALEQILNIFDAKNAYYWSTHAGAELDLLIMFKGKRYGFEFKLSDAPSSSKSMHVAIDDLNLEKLFVIYPGQKRYMLAEKIEAMPLGACCIERNFEIMNCFELKKNHIHPPRSKPT